LHVPTLEDWRLSDNPLPNFEGLQLLPNLEILRCDRTDISSFKGGVTLPRLRTLHLLTTPISQYDTVRIMASIVFGDSLQYIDQVAVSRPEAKLASDCRPALLKSLLDGWILSSVNPLLVYDPATKRRRRVICAAAGPSPHRRLLQISSRPETGTPRPLKKIPDNPPAITPPRERKVKDESPRPFKPVRQTPPKKVPERKKEESSFGIVLKPAAKGGDQTEDGNKPNAIKKPQVAPVLAIERAQAAKDEEEEEEEEESAEKQEPRNGNDCGVIGQTEAVRTSPPAVETAPGPIVNEEAVPTSAPKAESLPDPPPTDEEVPISVPEAESLPDPPPQDEEVATSAPEADGLPNPPPNDGEVAQDDPPPAKEDEGQVLTESVADAELTVPDGAGDADPENSPADAPAPEASDE
jgi:hypothetical protein